MAEWLVELVAELVADRLAPTLHWQAGFEFELLAPPGATRRTLADALAVAHGGSVRVVFHQESELSQVPGTPVFDNLSQGFEVLDARGAVLARLVDDSTLQHGLNPQAPGQPGWFRIVSDDRRLLQLVARVGRADGNALDALAPVAALFGTQAELLPGGLVRITTQDHAPLALAAPLPGERARGCEVVTPPLRQDHAQHINALLGPARALGFTLALESATHVHFDAAPLHNAAGFARLVALLHCWGPTLKWLVQCNPACRRLGDWPAALLDMVAEHSFQQLQWPQARARLQTLGLSKFCDFNLKNLVHDVPGKPTFEVRVLPGLLTGEAAVASAALFEALLQRAVQGGAVAWAAPLAPGQQAGAALLTLLALDPPLHQHWLQRLRALPLP